MNIQRTKRTNNKKSSSRIFNILCFDNNENNIKIQKKLTNIACLQKLQWQIFSLYYPHPSIASTIKPYKPYIPNRPTIEQLTANTIAICVSMIICCFFMIETHLNNLCDCLGSLWCDYNLLSWTVKLVLRQTMFGFNCHFNEMNDNEWTKREKCAGVWLVLSWMF